MRRTKATLIYRRTKNLRTAQLRRVVVEPKTRQEKMPLNYERDRRNTYGENSKASRKRISLAKADFRTASILKDGRVVFNIAGNKYRLVTSINYPYGIVFVKFVGTHKQYDAIDAQTIEGHHGH